MATEALLNRPRSLRLHGMARLAYDDARLYLNGRSTALADDEIPAIAALCARRRLDRGSVAAMTPRLLRWLLAGGAFDSP